MSLGVIEATRSVQRFPDKRRPISEIGLVSSRSGTWVVPRGAAFFDLVRMLGFPRSSDCGSVLISGGLQGERRRIVLGQDDGDRVQVADAAFRAQRGIEALASEVVVDVGDVGLLRVGESEQPAAFDETLSA